MRYLLPLLLVPVLLIAYQAHAQEPRMCTMQYAPVCGAKPVQCVAAPCYPQYHTYGNSCVLGAEGGTFIHEGECTAEETGPVIPKDEVQTSPMITEENVEVATQVMEVLATATPTEDSSFWDRMWYTILSWIGLR